MFGRKTKKKTSVDPILAAELDAGVHVMQDDLDELSGKPATEKKQSPVSDIDDSGSGSPFLSSGSASLPQIAPAHPSTPVSDDTKKAAESVITFDKEEDPVPIGGKTEDMKSSDEGSGGFLGKLFGSKADQRTSSKELPAGDVTQSDAVVSKSTTEDRLPERTSEIKKQSMSKDSSNTASAKPVSSPKFPSPFAQPTASEDVQATRSEQPKKKVIQTPPAQRHTENHISKASPARTSILPSGKSNVSSPTRKNASTAPSGGTEKDSLKSTTSKAPTWSKAVATKNQPEAMPHSSAPAPRNLPAFSEPEKEKTASLDAPASHSTDSRDSEDLASMLASLGSNEKPRTPSQKTLDSVPSLSNEGTDFSAIDMIPPAPEAPKANDIPVAPNPSTSSRRLRWAFPAGALLLIIVAAGAAFYFFLSPEIEPDVTEPSPASEISDEPGSVEVEETPELEPFSREMPNILILDTESEIASAVGIKELLDETEVKVYDMNPSLPIEFVIRDVNNNPIAFSRFAFLFELPMPADTLALFDEDFSLYFVMDGNEVRRALSLSIREDTDVSTALRAGEMNMPKWFDSLLYGTNTSLPDKPEFHDGSYGTLETRFANFGDGGLSLDYAVLDDVLIVGTSKDSFRAALGNAIRIR